MSDLTIPRINKMQFGIIDESFVNRATRMANDFATLKPKLEKMLLVAQTEFARIPILAKIESSEMAQEVEIELLGSAEAIRVEVAWKYKWKKVQIQDEATIIPTDEDGHPEIEDVTSDIIAEAFGGNSGLAYNVAEMANVVTAPVIFGIDMETATYPAGFRPMPVEDGAYVSLVAHKTFDEAYFFYTFDRQGVHDGQCAAIVPDPDE
jgi:hypothetical protein